MRQPVEVLNVFNTWEYCFLVENTSFENASFPYKTDILEANVKTNRMMSTKWTYRKEWSFPSNYLIFFENFFSV